MRLTVTHHLYTHKHITPSLVNDPSVLEIWQELFTFTPTGTVQILRKLVLGRSYYLGTVFVSIYLSFFLFRRALMKKRFYIPASLGKDEDLLMWDIQVTVLTD